MIIAIICFTSDEASINQYETLVSNFTETNNMFDGYKIHQLKGCKNNLFLFKTDKESVYYENIDEEIFNKTEIKPELIVFVTKHQAKSGINSLSCHTPGNFGIAEYGGKNYTLTPCPSQLIKEIFLALKNNNQNMNLGYEVIIECTHHGPYINTPNIFIEIGSNLESWKNKKASEVTIKSLLDVIPTFSFEFNENTAIGIGGLHHCPEFTKMILRNNMLISHVCPKYMLNQLTEESLDDAINKSIPKITHILLDWKSLANKENILPIIYNMEHKYNLRVLKTKEV